MLNQKNKYSPDVLDCIANLSNDEVFTSPKLANQMLDMLPQELFMNPGTKFLDPCCKSGVFLREIVKRLDKGLEFIIPDRQARINHILHKQVFGIAITELTAQLSRRTLYCSKYACAIKSGDIWISNNEDSKHGIHETHSYSISEFTADDVNDFCISPIQGNIRFNKEICHDYSEGDTCSICGANKHVNTDYDHAYELLHIDNERLEALKNMQWDLIIGNPPYQLSDGGGTGDSAKPIYNKFIEQAKKLQPRYLAMIVPSRWMKGGKGLDKFREVMMQDTSIKKMYDYENAEDCFSGVHIDGGVCYFLRDETYNGVCEFTHICENGYVDVSKRFLTNSVSNTIIRDNRQLSIIEKAKALTQDTMPTIISARNPYGFCADLFNAPERYPNADLSMELKEKYIKVYGVKGIKGGAKRVVGWVNPNSIEKNEEDIKKYKILFSKAYSANATVPPEMIVCNPNEICTETFLQIGLFNTDVEALNCLKYIKTRFFRALLQFGRAGMNNSAKSFELVPLQDFKITSDIDWTQSITDIDKQLYEKYKLSEADIEFIETNITSMDNEKEEVEESED